MNRSAGIDMRWAVIVILMAIGLALVLGRMPGGVGGTGIGGVGGTGIGGVGGTGIFGRIDGFGSVWVNGREVHYDDEMTISYRGDDAAVDQLALGQIVAVVADDGESGLSARAITIVEEIIGTLDAPLENGKLINVLGQKVLLTQDTILALDAASSMSIGDVVAVSGYRAADETVIATRITTAPKEERYFVRGPIANVGDASFTIGALEIAYPVLAHSEGDIVEVSGRMDNGEFIAETVSALPTYGFDAVELLSYQGVSRSADTGAPTHVGRIIVKEGETSPPPTIDARYNIAIIEGLPTRSNGSISVVAQSYKVTPVATLAPRPGENYDPAQVEGAEAVDSDDRSSETGDSLRDEPAPLDTENGQDRAASPVREENETISDPDLEVEGVREASPQESDREPEGEDETRLTDSEPEQERSDATTPEREAAGDEAEPSDEVERPATDEPSDAARPETEQPETERPETERPETERPERPERPQREPRSERPARPQRGNR